MGTKYLIAFKRKEVWACVNATSDEKPITEIPSDATEQFFGTLNDLSELELNRFQAGCVIYNSNKTLAFDHAKFKELIPSERSDEEVALELVHYNRLDAYPSIGDQLDSLYKAGSFDAEMTAKIKAVKDKFPK